MGSNTPHYFHTIPGFFWFEHGYRRFLAALPDDRPSAWVEIGALQGRSTAFLGVEAARLGKPVSLHVVDSWQFPTPEKGAELYQAFQRQIQPVVAALGEDRVNVYRLPSMEAVKLFEDESVDVVWVDGDHHYEACRADILAWWPKLKVGGYMGGDDWNMEPVQRAVVEQFAPHYLLGHGYCTDGKYSGPWPYWFARKSQ